MHFLSPVRFTYLLLACIACGPAAARLPEFQASPWFHEQTRWETTTDGVRVFLDAPAAMDANRPTLVVFYATPNGNTIEQTLGCKPAKGLDWHYDIQHIAAQTRKLRDLERGTNIALVVVQPEEKSWPAWRQTHPENAARIRALVTECAARFPGSPRRVALAAHSGGGSFLFGFLNGGEAIPADVTRIAFLDANYSYSDSERHGNKLLTWLIADTSRHLVVLAYDDRNITLDGKRVVGPTGGTYRATHRMLDRFGRAVALDAGSTGNLDTWSALGVQARFLIDRNPSNKILHTVLVETNGFLEAMTAGTPEERAWGEYRGPRAYSRWIQPEPFVASTVP
jgi:hypothetical protein